MNLLFNSTLTFIIAALFAVVGVLAQDPLVYHGGAVMNTVNVYLIW